MTLERLSDPESSNAAAVPGGGYNFRRPTRFRRMSELYAAYESARGQRGNQQAWSNIMKCYNREPWKNGSQVLANFGGFRASIDDKIAGYVDHATERQTWMSIETYEGDEDRQTSYWSQQITYAANKFIIGRWKGRALAMIESVRDMMLMSKGIMVTLKKNQLYPESMSPTSVWPDSRAGQTSDKWDLCFVEDTLTRTELYRMIASEEGAEAEGWDRQAVLRVLADVSTHTSMESEAIETRYQRGFVKAKDAEGEVDVVYAFVREYAASQGENGAVDRDGTETVSKLVFLKKGSIPRAPSALGKEITNTELDDAGYLLYKPRAYDCMTQLVNVMAHQVCRCFYEDPSLGEMLYTSAKTEDLVTARVLQGVEDNMRTYFSSESPVHADKLKRMQHGQFNVLEPGMTIAQNAIRKPIQEAMAVVRMLKNNSDSNTGTYSANARDEASGYKTAKQSELDFNSSLKIDSAALKVFNAFMTYIMDEVYRRAVTIDDNAPQVCEWDKKSMKLFKKYLKNRGIPPEAWKHENCMVTSVLELGSSSPAARLQAARVTLEALSIPAGDEGTNRAKWDMIASVQGVQNADFYINPNNEGIPEDALIGLENDALSSPSGGGDAVKVLQAQLHLRHIPSHIDMATQLIQRTFEYYNAIPQMNPNDEGLHIMKVMDLLQGVENLLTHTRAHMIVAGQTQNKNILGTLQQAEVAIQRVNQAHDEIMSRLTEQDAARMNRAQEMNPEDPDIMKKRELARIEVQKKDILAQQEVARNERKATQLEENSDRRTQQELENRQRSANVDTAIKLGQAQLEAQLAASKQ